MQAYLAMYEFLNMEMKINEQEEVHLGGLLAEMNIEENGESADPGAIAQFEDAVQKILAEKSGIEVE